MPAFLELFLDQGTTFIRTLTLTDDTNGGSLNVLGYTISCNARKSYTSFSPSNSSPDIVFSCNVVDGKNGVLAISQTASNTANYYPRRYWYDVLAISTDGTRSRLLEGILTVTPSVS
jgi:hypothetical protein